MARAWETLALLRETYIVRHPRLRGAVKVYLGRSPALYGNALFLVRLPIEVGRHSRARLSTEGRQLRHWGSRLAALATALDGKLRRLLRPKRSPPPTEKGVGQVESADRVVRKHPIFSVIARSAKRDEAISARAHVQVKRDCFARIDRSIL
jgi:hypothetical protein